MELDKTMKGVLHELAESLGYETRHCKITVVSEHEYLYSGVETLVTITGKKGEKITHLKIRKPPTTGDELKIPWNNCFFNNVHYYSAVLPILKTYGNVPMNPKYYGSSLKKGEEYLILEDLEKSENYKRLGPFPGLSRKHVSEVIKMLAHFHCTVQLWKTKNNLQFKSICTQFKPFLGSEYMRKVDCAKHEKILKETLTAIWMMMRGTNCELRQNFQKLLRHMKVLMAQALKDGHEVDDQPWTTIANCFTYTTNLLFKLHTVTGAVIDVGLEDWGACRLGSPALDLTLLIFSSPAKDVYPETMALVNEYFVEHMSTSDLFEVHIPRFGIFGVLGGVFITIAKAVEEQLDLRLDQITSAILSEASFTSNTIPDVKERLVAIMKAAVDCRIV